MPTFPDSWSHTRVVLSHDWLTGMRGGERVLEILCKGFPSAPIVTLIHKPGAVSDVISRHDIRVSWLRRIPSIATLYRYLLPVFPSAVESMCAPEADLLISTSHCVAKGLPSKPGTRHLCYCFTPMRYAWTFYDEYFGNSRARALAAKAMLPRLRAWDRKTSDRVDRFVAISRHVQQRIKDFYNRDADVVYPPVDTERCTPGSGTSGDFDLIVSALVPYKRIDLAVDAYRRAGRRLKVVGTGSELKRLQAMAGPNTEFLGWVSDEAVLDLYRQCRLLVFPGEEDFGIVPLEAQACGRPVVAYRKGGALETVQEEVSGVFFEEQSPESLLEAVDRCSAARWDPQAIRAHAEAFSVQNFIDNLAVSIRRCLEA
jgi:glycosyltransferase involved in cell wall biosynthesis